MNTSIENYYSGISGLVLPVPNKLHYPDEFKNRSRLCYYASLTNSIEINSTFYKIPLSSTIKKWTSEVPEYFRFTFKLFKGITHNRELTFEPEMVTDFFNVIAGVAHKKGCLLVQLPPSVRIGQFSRLNILMAVLNENNKDDKWKIALEFRHPSLYCDKVYELLDSYKISMVIHDKFATTSPIHAKNQEFVYLRFHGPEGNYKGSYEEDILHKYAFFIKEYLDENKQVYVYFNNTMGEAFANLIMLRQIVQDNIQ